MTNDWIEFKEKGYELRRRMPRVLLNKDKMFRLNKLALELIGNPEAVRFLYDAGRNRVGIRAESPESDYSFPVRHQDRGQTATVHASLFCNRFGIRPEATIEFEAVRVDVDGTLILELSTAKTLPPRFYLREAARPNR